MDLASSKYDQRSQLGPCLVPLAFTFAAVAYIKMNPMRLSHVNLLRFNYKDMQKIGYVLL
jgi:hypothetical protein